MIRPVESKCFASGQHFGPAGADPCIPSPGRKESLLCHAAFFHDDADIKYQGPPLLTPWICGGVEGPLEHRSQIPYRNGVTRTDITERHADHSQRRDHCLSGHNDFIILELLEKVKITTLDSLNHLNLKMKLKKMIMLLMRTVNRVKAAWDSVHYTAVWGCMWQFLCMFVLVPLGGGPL